jgi:TPR repeat protein
MTDVEAVKWYRLAADQGLASAQGGLGWMYAQGQGVAQDYVLAHMWSNLAASREKDATLRDMAIKLRDQAAAMMTPAQLAEAQRLAREWKPTGVGG